MRHIIDRARSDPVGAGFVISAAALVALVIIQLAPAPDDEGPRWQWPELLRPPSPAAKPLQSPPTAWAATAKPGDVLQVPGYQVAYWGRPDAKYGSRATQNARKPLAIVVHFTDNRPMLNLVRQQHEGDRDRGGYGYGYHVYIDPQGRIAQGAPLSVRTNHIKPANSPQRKPGLGGIDNTDTISISLVGACRSPAMSPITYHCSAETVSDVQLEAGMAVVRAVRDLFGIPCAEIYGHGDLQTDRQAFEGLTLSRKARGECDNKKPGTMAGLVGMQGN